MQFFYPIILFGLLFSSVISCGGGSGSSADLNLSAQNCGNALVNENESCDDGNTNNSDGCNAHCAWEVGEAICGNGVLENEECCDDGNNVSGDGCSSACTSERNNRSPSAPILAAEPANGATWAPTRLYLSWNAATDPDAGDQVVYDVYFVDGGNGISPTAIPYKKGISDTHFIIQASTDNRAQYFPDVLSPIYLKAPLAGNPSRDYFWKICARDKFNATACSETRVFKTDDSVVGWWRFDEDLSQPSVCEGEASNSSRKVCDYSGNNNHGVANGSPAWLPSPSNLLGSAIQFDGVDDYIEIINNPTLNIIGQFTLIANLKITNPISGGGGKIISKISQGVVGPIGYNLDVVPGQFRLGSLNDSLATSSTVATILTVGSVFRVNGMFTGVSTKLFVNGNLENETLGGIAPGSNISNLTIGGLPPFGFYLNGISDEVMIYDRALSDFEALNDYECTLL